MKKSKVDALIKKFSNDAFKDGKTEGQLKERSRWEKILPPPGSVDNVCYVGPTPEALRFIVPILENGRYPIRMPMSKDYDYYYMRSQFSRIEFEAIPMALTLTTGQQFRWFHWKPIGPYPVSELAVMR